MYTCMGVGRGRFCLGGGERGILGFGWLFFVLFSVYLGFCFLQACEMKASS